MKFISRLILNSKKNDNKAHLLRITRLPLFFIIVLKRSLSQVNEIEKQKDKLLELYMDDSIDKNVLTRKMVQLEQDEKKLEKERNEVQTDKQNTYKIVIELIDYLKDIYDVYSSGNKEDKKKILSKLVNEIIINEDNSFQVFWKSPIKFLVKNEIMEYKSKIEGIKKGECEISSHSPNSPPT